MKRVVSWRLLVGMLLLIVHADAVHAQEFELAAPASLQDPKLALVMRDLAERVLPVYQERDADRYLMNLAALQLTVGDIASAARTREELRDRRRNLDPDRMLVPGLIYDIYAGALRLAAEQNAAFDAAYKAAYRDQVRPLNDLQALRVSQGFAETAQGVDALFQSRLQAWQRQGGLSLVEALDIVRSYIAWDALRRSRPLVAALNQEEDQRRYVIQDRVLIPISRHVKILARIVRPRQPAQKMPALLEFSLLSSQNSAKESAAHGYVGVMAYTRGKGRMDAARIYPFLHDGDDARAVIQWISRQSWSDGRVAMIGEGYSGFAAWAVAKRVPEALKAIATSAPMAPGIDFPMAGNIRHNAAYRWAYAHARTQDKPQPESEAQWQERDRAWYRSGKPYRQFDRRGQRADRVFSSWLDHPSYDRYWQKLIPYEKQFAGIEIPVLTLAGYYGADAGALYYFGEHLRWRPEARHSLLIGPYDEAMFKRGIAAPDPASPMDAVAAIDLKALRYQWLDHVLKNAAKPALLRDRVNVQLAGANQWRHAPSIESLANGSLRLYLDPSHLVSGLTSGKGFVDQTVNLRDRKDMAASFKLPRVGAAVKPHNALSFISDPLPQPQDLIGLISGQLDLLPNKLDMDLNFALYEVQADGRSIALFEPYEVRASYLRNRSERTLLKGGKRQQLPFTIEHLGSRQLQAGSRLQLVLGVNKRPDREINYGSGKPVSEETIVDARQPLKIRWFNSSYIDLPVRK